MGSTSRCSTSRTRTPVTSSNGSQTTSRLPSATSHHEASRCPAHSSVTRPPSRNSSSESPSSSLPCSVERLSSTGTPVKVWTRWNSPKPSPTLTISSPNTSSTRTPPPRTMPRMKKKKMKHNSTTFNFSPYTTPNTHSFSFLVGFFVQSHHFLETGLRTLLLRIKTLA